MPQAFIQQLNVYTREFINSQPSWLKTIHTLVLEYFRKGKITDLIYIVDQMLNHLTAIHGPQSHNNDIYNDIQFDQKKQGLIEFIKQISTLNQHLLSLIDSGCQAVLSSLAVIIGLVLVIASVFSIVPLLIGLPLVLGGVYATYHFATKAHEQLENLQPQQEQLIEKLQGLPENDSLFSGKNYRAFYGAVIKLSAYVPIAAVEQVVLDESQQQQITEERDKLDSSFRTVAI